MDKKVVLDEIMNYNEAAAAASRLEDKEEDANIGFFVQTSEIGGYCVVCYGK